MPYEEAKGALDDLYKIFDRNIITQRFGTAKNLEEFTEEELERMKIDGFLKDEPVEKGEIPVKYKFKRVFSLLMVFSKFSVELFGKNLEGDYGSTFLELKDRYSQGEVYYDFIGEPRFLRVFREKLKLNL